MKYRLFELRKDWRNLWVCEDCWEPKHPQLIPPRLGPESVPRVVLLDRTKWINGTNIITNPEFELYTGNQDGGVTGTFTGWEVEEENGVVQPSSVIRMGFNALGFINYGDNPGPYVYQDCTVVATGSYTFSFYTKSDGTVQSSYGLYDVSNSADIVATTASGITGDYQLVTTNITAPAGCTSIRVYLYGANGATGSCYIDSTKLIRTA